MSEAIHIGSHLFRLEPPDTVLWRLVGDISEVEMRRLCDEMEPIATGKDYLLMLVDLSSGGEDISGARKAAIEARGPRVLGTGIVGASAHLRIIANFSIRAANLLLAESHNPIRFFATEPEARAWLAERRRVALQESR